ncbi:MAG TPA: hypothetical protein VF434_15890 [Promineifilum sp.]
MAKQKSRGLLDRIEDIGDEIGEEIRELFGRQPAEPAGGKPEPVTRRVSLVIHDPKITSAGRKQLSQVLGWNETGKLVKGFIGDLKECSGGYANYEIVDEITVDGMARKADGYVYDPDEFVRFWKARKGFHQPDLVDYDALMSEFKMVEKVESGEIDEFWLFAFPYGGYYESIMGGPGAFWCNAPPLTQTNHMSKRFVIMGFNYERGVGEMLEAYGHRAESIMKHVFRNERGDDNLWKRFWRHEHENPGRAEVGWMHYAPNSVRDYDWGNKRKVLSRWRTWKNFPNLEGEAEMVDCRDWGNGDIRLHHKWWFDLLPKVTGSADGISYNWWKYIVDPNTVD